MSVGEAAERGPDPMALVADGRAHGAARLDPVRFAVIEALARRAAGQQGEARRLLVRRVEQLLAQCAAAQPAAKAVDAAADACTPRPDALAALSGLVDRLGRSQAPPEPAERVPSLSQVAAPASLRAVTVFKATWSRLRAERRLRQALAQVPAMAGPLNSAHVINRTLQAMRELSPEYLDAFMAHVDTLLWLERATGRTPAAARPKGRQAVRGRNSSAS